MEPWNQRDAIETDRFFKTSTGIKLLRVLDKKCPEYESDSLEKGALTGAVRFGYQFCIKNILDISSYQIQQEIVSSFRDLRDEIDSI